MSSPHPSAVLFARGTLARLALWPALRIAVHAGWGGPASTEKQRWLAGVLVDQFEPFLLPAPAPAPAPGTGPEPGPSGAHTRPPPDAIDVEDRLLQIMADEFDVVLEDDSAAAVARDLVRLCGAVHAGDAAFVQALEAQADRVRGTLPTYEMRAGSGSESDDSGSEWEEEADGEAEEHEGESVPQLLNHPAPQTRQEPQIDEDGFTLVTKKGQR